MIEPILIISNNPLTQKKLKKKHYIEFIDGTVLQVFTAVRDKIHQGHILLTHPLVSSIKPNQMPYRTVILSKKRNNTIDMESLLLYENCRLTLEKFLKDYKIPQWNLQLLMDFQVIDYDLTCNDLME